MEKRKEVEELIIKTLLKMEPGGVNSERYKKIFSEMSDKDFDLWMQGIRDKKEKLVIYAPNMKITLKTPDLLSASRSLGVKLFEKVKMWDKIGKRYFTTPHEYLVLRLPVRRNKQFLFDKISIPESDRNISQFTGQVRQPDKGSSMSTIEMQTLVSKGLNNTVQELMNIRGGNVENYAIMKSSLDESGTVSLKELDTNYKPRSAKSLQVYLMAMGLENNFAKD